MLIFVSPDELSAKNNDVHIIFLPDGLPSIDVHLTFINLPLDELLEKDIRVTFFTGWIVSERCPCYIFSPDELLEKDIHVTFFTGWIVITRCPCYIFSPDELSVKDVLLTFFSPNKLSSKDVHVTFFSLDVPIAAAAADDGICWTTFGWLDARLASVRQTKDKRN
jgi:hypothetical protein